ncbi:MAG: GAF domain-containing protein [Candidatus Omnitrophica bacterium]|nr:GAF domain-containing protein [Candidatus Omnitrophota bacterium]
MSVIVLSKGNKTITSRIWAAVCLTAAIWGIGSFNIANSKLKMDAMFWWQFGYVGVILTPVLYFHFVCEYINVKQNKLIIFSYLLAGVFLCVNILKPFEFFGDLTYMFNEFYYVDWMKDRNILWLIFYLVFYWILLLYSFVLLLKSFYYSYGLQRQQMKYFILGSTVGWLGPHGQYLAYLGVDFYPISNFLIAIYPIIMGYAIVKYRLMDITLAVTRTGLFVLVYATVLGIPFAIAFGWQPQLRAWFGESWWVFPLVSSTILATLGPFIYLYLQTKAEARLFQEQHRYQSILRKASLGMGRIKDLKRLLNLIVQIVTRTVRIEHCEIYLLDEANEQFVLKASKNAKPINELHQVIPVHSMLIHHLRKIKEPLVFEEVKQRALDYGDDRFIAIREDMQTIENELILPTFVEHRLIALISLGRMKSGKPYGQSDLVVFSILANQSALAIENAQFYEDMKKTHEQLFKAEKMATIGTMADGLSHQINNRLHAMGFIAGDALDTINLCRDRLHKDGEAEKVLEDVTYALDRIQDNVRRGGEIVEGLLKYTRKGQQGFVEVELEKLLAAALEMASFKIRMSMLKIEKHFGDDIPVIYGNFTQLQEVFFNLIDNAYDAMMQRKEELEEEGYHAKLDIYATRKGKQLEVILKDNGMGVKQEDMKKLFTPFFTTKLSSRKGTGLGLYVIRQLIEESHKGKVIFTSEYKVGSQTRLILPINQEELNIQN